MIVRAVAPVSACDSQTRSALERGAGVHTLQQFDLFGCHGERIICLCGCRGGNYFVNVQ